MTNNQEKSKISWKNQEIKCLSHLLMTGQQDCSMVLGVVGYWWPFCFVVYISPREVPLHPSCTFFRQYHHIGNNWGFSEQRAVFAIFVWPSCMSILSHCWQAQRWACSKKGFGEMGLGGEFRGSSWTCLPKVQQVYFSQSLVLGWP